MGYVVRVPSVKRSKFRQRGASPAESAPRQNGACSTTHATLPIRIQRKFTGGTVHKLCFCTPEQKKSASGLFIYDCTKQMFTIICRGDSRIARSDNTQYA